MGVFIFRLFINKMFWIENKKYSMILDIFMSSSTVMSLIFQSVIAIGYLLLVTGNRKCNINPNLEVYFHCMGVLSLLVLLTLFLFVLRSHKEVVCVQRPKTSLEEPDATSVISQSVSSRILHQRRLDTISGSFSTLSHTDDCSSCNTIQSTEWALYVGKIIRQAVYSIFFLLHLCNLIMGSVILFPLFFDLDLQLGKVIADEGVCNPPLFWFTFITLAIEYLLILIFTCSFCATIWQEELVVLN